MQSLRIIVEPQFSIEQRVLNQRSSDLSAQSGYLLIHSLNLLSEKFPAHASLLLNPNQTIQLAAGHSCNDLLLVRLTPQLLLEAATRLRLHCTGAHLLFRHALTPITDDKNLSAVLNGIQHEISEGAAGWREMIRAQVNQLAVYLLRSHINVQRSDEIELSRVGIVDRRLRRALEFMHDNCGRELSLSEIAAAAYLSEFHFARLFKKITGTTPHAHLASLRIEKARRLLAETDFSISEIGARVGYGSQSHFTKIFREATGLTPRAFREAAQQSG